MFTPEKIQVITRILEENRDSVYKETCRVQSTTGIELGTRMMRGRAASDIGTRTERVIDAMNKGDVLNQEDLKWIIHLLSDKLKKLGI